MEISKNEKSKNSFLEIYKFEKKIFIFGNLQIQKKKFHFCKFTNSKKILNFCRFLAFFFGFVNLQKWIFFFRICKFTKMKIFFFEFVNLHTLKIAFLKRQISWDFWKQFSVFKTLKIFLYVIVLPINFFGVSKRSI